MGRKAKQRPRKGTVIAAQVAGMAFAASAGGVAVVAANHVPTVPPGVAFLGRQLEGMTRAEAEAAVDQAWAEAANRSVRLEHRGEAFGPPRKLGELGYDLDRRATLGSMPMDTFAAYWGRQIGIGTRTDVEIRPKLKRDSARLEALAAEVSAKFGVASPASARWVGGKVVLRSEEPGSKLDADAMEGPVSEALAGQTTLRLPVVSAEPSVPESELRKIDGPLGTYTTSFSEGNRPRSHNIRTAARTLDGTVLPPGGKLSFNGHLGRRTAQKGYREAGVYVSGRHDTDIGGGICQVSTTLFNAALMAGLEPLDRSPHSLPVPYVPLGRDAAVSYPKPDLVLRNPYEFPVAVSGSVAQGKLTFTVLGATAAKPKVELSQRMLASWSRGVKYIEDKSLPPGAQRVEDRGGAGHRASTTYTVTRPGQAPKTTTFESVYGGGPRIVRINRSPKPAAPKPAEPPAAAPPAAPAAAPAPAEG